MSDPLTAHFGQVAGVVVAELRALQTTAHAAGRLVEAGDLRDQVIAVETLNRLHAELGEHIKAGRDDAAAGMGPQIEFWLRRVDGDLLSRILDGRSGTAAQEAAGAAVVDGGAPDGQPRGRGR